MAYLGENHPEVFFMTPRPGGIAKITLPDVVGPAGEAKSSRGTITSKRSSRSARSLRSMRSRGSARSKSGFPIDDYFKVSPGFTSREYRVTTAMISSPWVLFDNTFQEFPKAPNPAQDVIDLLAVTISTVMLLAAGYGGIPKENQKWTLSYLENIRDGFGNHPPNVTGIINHLKMLDPELESFNDHGRVSIEDEEKISGGPDREQTLPEAASPEEVPPEEAA